MIRFAASILASAVVWSGAAMAQGAAVPESAPAAEPAAEAAAAAPVVAAIPMETLTLGKAKGKFGEEVFSAGGYVFATRTRVSDVSGPFSIDVLGASRQKIRLEVFWRFAKEDGSPVNDGECQLDAKMWSGLWNTADNTLYFCDFLKLPDDQFALEAIVPNMERESDSMFSVTEDAPEKFEVLKARLMYKGVLYEATPTSLAPVKERARRQELAQRVANGYTITRGGQPVGRIDFPEIKKSGFMVVGPGFDRKSIITAPVSEADGREAVIFFASQLLRVPEANSPIVHSEMIN